MPPNGTPPPRAVAWRSLLAWPARKARQLADKARQDRLRRRIGRQWGDRGTGFARFRKYSDYQTYVKHQRAKMEFASICPLDLADYDLKYRAALKQRLEKAGLSGRGNTALCLGARLGTEVKAFLDLEYLAIGLDLRPGDGNRWVVAGDFHDIQFPSDSFDLAFSNSLDHAFDLDKMLAEVRRVLKPGGIFVLEAPIGEEEGGKAGYYESLYWDQLQDLLEHLVTRGFSIIYRREIDFPFPGLHVHLQNQADPNVA